MLPFLIENSLFADKSSKDNLLKNKTTIMDSLFFNFFGFLGLFKMNSSRGPMNNYGTNESKLMIQSISDANLDVSLSIKLAYDVGLINIDIVNRMTKLLVLIKQKKIDDKSLDENLVRAFLDVIHYNTNRPSPLVFDIVQKFHNGQFSLERLSAALADLSMRKEFAGITTEFRKIIINGMYRPLFQQYMKTAVPSNSNVSQTTPPSPMPPVPASAPTAGVHQFSSIPVQTPKTSISPLPAPTAGVHHPSIVSQTQPPAAPPPKPVIPPLDDDAISKLFTAQSNVAIDVILNKYNITLMGIFNKLDDFLARVGQSVVSKDFAGHSVFLDRYIADKDIPKEIKNWLLSKIVSKTIDYYADSATAYIIPIDIIDRINRLYLVPHGCKLTRQLSSETRNNLTKIVDKWIKSAVASTQLLSPSNMMNNWNVIKDALAVILNCGWSEAFENAVQSGYLTIPKEINYTFTNLALIKPNVFAQISIAEKKVIILNTFGSQENVPQSSSKFRVSYKALGIATVEVKTCWSKLEELGIAEKISGTKVEEYKSVFGTIASKMVGGYYYSFTEMLTRQAADGQPLPSNLSDAEIKELSQSLVDIPNSVAACCQIMSSLTNLLWPGNLTTSMKEITEIIQIINANPTGLLPPIWQESYKLDLILADTLNLPKLKKQLVAEVYPADIVEKLENVFNVRLIDDMKNGLNLLLDRLSQEDFIAKPKFFIKVNTPDAAREGVRLILPSNEKDAVIFLKEVIKNKYNVSSIRPDFFFELYKKYPKTKEIVTVNMEEEFVQNPNESIFSINHVTEDMITPKILDAYKKYLVDSPKNYSTTPKHLPTSLSDVQISDKLKNAISEVASKILITPDLFFNSDSRFESSIRDAHGEAVSIMLQTHTSFKEIQEKKIGTAWGWNRKTGYRNALKVDPGEFFLCLRSNESFIKTVKPPLLKQWFLQIFREMEDKDLYPKQIRERTFKEIAETLGALKEAGRENEIPAIFDGLPTQLKKPVTQHLLQYEFIDSAKNSLVSGEIKPLFDIDHKRMIEIFKYNSIDVPSIDMRTYKTYRDIMGLGGQVRGLADLAVEPVKADVATLERQSIEYDKFNKYKHGMRAFIFEKEFKVDLPIQRKGMLEFLEQHPNTEIMDPVFHGTGSIGASMILRYGFTVFRSNDPLCAGRLLGDGIYFSTVLDKVGQYIGEAGHSRQIGNRGYILQCKAALGDYGKNYKTAGVKDTKTISPEWCVYDINKQLYIYKAFLVKLVKKEDMDAIKSKHRIQENNIMKIETFTEFLREVREEQAYKNVTTYTFIDGSIPIDENTVVDFEDFDAKAFGPHVYIEVSQNGPMVGIEHNGPESEAFVSRYYTDLTNNFDELHKFLGLLKDPDYYLKNNG
jgi:hypothetical protein